MSQGLQPLVRYTRVQEIVGDVVRLQASGIALFNCLVESQKISIFSVAGEPHNELLARIGFQADADVLVPWFGTCPAMLIWHCVNSDWLCFLRAWD